MKRTLFSLMVAGLTAGFAISATALPIVSLVATSGGTVQQGSQVTLQAEVTVASGDGSDLGIFGALIYPSAGTGLLTGSASPGGQTALPSSPGGFATGTLGTCSSIRCTMFTQTGGLNGSQTANQTGFVIATAAYTVLLATPVNTVLTWSWQTTPTGSRLDFFGITNAPGVSVTVVPVPEPTTIALLGLGIIGLAVAGRRRA